MKKRVMFLLLLALAAVLVFSLAACSLLGISGGSSGQAPTYKSATISNTSQSGTETLIYAETYDSVYITINLDNPDDLVIASVTINGKTYEASTFESGSSRKQIVIRVNVYDETGIVPFTVESIQYIDGKVLKDITVTANNVVYVGVFVEGQVAAFVTRDVGFTNVTLNVNVKDDNGLIAYSDGSVKIGLHQGDTLIESKTLTVGDNTVRFDGLEIGQWYWYDVLATYDDFREGNRERLLANDTVKTNEVVAFDNVVATYDGVEFDLKWHEDVADKTVKELHLIDGDKDVVLSDASATKVTGQLSGRDYTVVVYFDYDGRTYDVRRSFHTIEKHAPGFFCSNLWVTEDEISFNVMIDDPDGAGALVTTLDGQNVSALTGNKKQIKFSNLTYGHTYEIEISYDYDLNDGEGAHPLGESFTVTVDSQTIHQTSCKLGYSALDHTTCRVYKNTKCTHEVLAIPSTIDGYTVTKVDRFSNNYLTTLILPDTITEFVNSAFADCKNLTSVTLPQNLTVLGVKMFSGCESLTDVSIPTAVTEIPDEMFNGCKALTSITIPANVVTIGKKAFLASGLQTLTFENDSKLKTIGDEAFRELNKITELTLPERLVTIGNGAFDGLNQLTELTIPASVERIYNDAFSGCTRLQNLTFEADSKLFSIGDSAFYRCEALNELNLPSQLYSIHDRAFVGCGITSITIPASVYSIGSSAFASSVVGGGGLQELIFEPNGVLTTIGGGAFSNTALTRVTIPSGLISLGAQAFYNCSHLSRVAFEDDSKLQTIGDKAFYGCAFSGIILPAELRTIGVSAFELSGLSSVSFRSDSKLTTIGSKAFSGCRLSSIEIPVGVTSIGSYAFAECSYLRAFSVPSSVTSIGEGAFKDSGLATINYAIDGKLATIGAYAFEGCKITQIFIPKSVVTIGEGAYKGFGNIAAITFEEGSQLQTIGASAFEGCATVSQVTVPASVLTISDGAFKNCTGLRTFTFEEGSRLQSIGANFFEGGNLITEIVIPASVTSIGDYAFQNLANLQAVQFETGSQLQSIGSGAFKGCSSLPYVTLPDGLVELRTSVFFECDALQWVVMPKSIKTIGNMAIERNSATIYYLGSYTEWCSVSMSSGDRNYFQEMYNNVCFFYGAPQDGHSWRYDRDGNPTPN